MARPALHPNHHHLEMCDCAAIQLVAYHEARVSVVVSLTSRSTVLKGKLQKAGLVGGFRICLIYYRFYRK